MNIQANGELEVGCKLGKLWATNQAQNTIAEDGPIFSLKQLPLG